MSTSTKRLFVGNDPNILPLEETGKRKQMQESIQSAAKEWQTTFDSIKDPIMILDSEFRKDVTPHKRAEEALERQLRFEILITNLSARFMNLPPAEIDQAIEAALEELLAFFQMDRWGLWEVAPGDKAVYVSHAYHAEGISEVPKTIDLALLFPWCHKKLVEQGEPCIFGRLADLPAEADLDKANKAAMGVQSFLDIPLFVGGKVKFIFAAKSMRQERSWPDEYLPWLRQLGEIFVNALERKRSAEQLARRLQFEELLSSLSSSFVGLASDGVEEEIAKWLRRLAEFFEAELCTLGEFSDDGEKLVRFLEYRSEGIGPSPSYLWQDEGPWFIQQLAGGNPVVVNRVEDLPAKAATEREVYLANGLKSVLAVPLVSAGKPLGVCTLFSFRREWVWPKGLIQRFQLVTKVFANVLERQRAEEALRRESALNAAVLDTARAIVLVLDAEGKVRRFNRYCEELSGYTFNEVQNRHIWDLLLIPEEVEAVKEAFEKLKVTGSADYFENYWKTKDGRLRRLAWSSMVIPDSKGEPELVVGIALDITSRKQMEEQLQARLQQIEELKLQLERENVYLREETKILSQSEHLVGESEALKGVLTLVQQVAPTSSTVLILGETGTGKELVAQAIHSLSQRKGRIMVKVNCASLPAALVESELFGREKGAYTGALTSQIGRFGLANGSTLFLDEIAELSLELQAKLLRVLQEGEFERLGCPKTIRVDVRVITASNRNLLEEVQKGKFREDLYYRLKVFPIEVPPLRKRPEDIPSLVWHFIEEFSEKMGKNIRRLSKETVEALQQYDWPGNVRELRNVIEQAFIISDGDVLKIKIPQGRSETAILTLKERDYQHILDALGKSQWHIKGPQGAARLLGLKPSTLYTKMNKLGIPSRRLKDGNPS